MHTFTRTPSRIRFLALAISVLPSALAYAEDAQPVMLQEIVVSGSRTATLLNDTPQAIGSVEAETLARDKPASIGDAINRVSGVKWNDLGNEQHSMGIRQPINTNAMYQYLEDGLPIRPLGIFNHNALNEINLNGVDRVEVVKGAASSLYGSNAVGGAVNFLTARPSRTPEGLIGLRHDAENGYTRLDTGGSSSFGAAGVRFAHYTAHRSRDNWQEYSYMDKDSFTLRGDYALESGSQLTSIVSHNNLDTAMTGSLFENQYRADPGQSLNHFTYRRDRATRVSLSWEGETTAQGLTTATLFTRDNQHDQLPSYQIRVTGASTATGRINENGYTSLGADLRHQQEWSALQGRLVAGVYVDHSPNRYRENNLSIVRDASTGDYLSYSVGSLRRDYQVNIRNAAPYLQYELSPAADFRLVIGGRYDYIGYDFTNHLTPSSTTGAPSETRSFSQFSPKLGLTWQLTPSSHTYGTLSQGFTPPEVSSLYSSLAVPDLKPATYTNYELGLRQTWLDGVLHLDSALYQLDGRDTIVSYSLAANASEPRNAGKTRSQGLEISLSADQPRWDARFSGTLASHRYLTYQASSTASYSGKTMPAAARTLFSSEVGVKPLSGLRLAAELNRQGGYWMNNANTVRYPGHTLLHLKAQYTQQAMEWWAQIRNATNTRYADSASSSFDPASGSAYNPDTQNQYTPGSPRSLMLGLTWRLGAR